jgi:hypothetical protein
MSTGFAELIVPIEIPCDFDFVPRTFVRANSHPFAQFSTITIIFVGEGSSRHETEVGAVSCDHLARVRWALCIPQLTFLSAQLHLMTVSGIGFIS